MTPTVYHAFTDELEKIALAGELIGGFAGGAASEALLYGITRKNPRFLRSLLYGLPGEIAGAHIGHQIEKGLRGRRRRKEKRAYAWSSIGRKSMWADSALPFRTKFKSVGAKPPSSKKVKPAKPLTPPQIRGSKVSTPPVSRAATAEGNNMRDLLENPFQTPSAET